MGKSERENEGRVYIAMKEECFAFAAEVCGMAGVVCVEFGAPATKLERISRSGFGL